MTTIEEIQTALKKVVPTIVVDGQWGAKSQAALEIAKSASINVPPPAPAQPVPNGWPKEADAAQFYGHSDGSSAWESANLVTFEAPYAFFMESQLVRRVRCHKKVKDSLYRILSAIQQLYKTPEAIHAVGLDQYDGCYNFRPVRGATNLSMHAYGAAIDFDAEHNPLGATHGRMPTEVVAIFKREGWRWGGDYSGRKDWMHFEACV